MVSRDGSNDKCALLLAAVLFRRIVLQFGKPVIQLVGFAVFAAAALAVVSWLTRRGGVAFLAAIWLVYAGYEFLMVKRVLCSGECNIRVDLLLILPVLVFGTLAVLGPLAWRALRGGRIPRRGA